ncbi:50S ribosomal protein L24 [Candidatus Woesearchaeota archaeon]|nr:50S ribosomal protein L24 [Candidatus Woesearchaeota archaeon]
MNKEWSSHWIASTQPRKQRKYRYNAPLHTLRKHLGCHLSKELRAKYKTRSVLLRSGDKVKVVRGQYKGHTGTVDRVNLSTSKVYVTGIEVIRKDGSRVVPPLHASNLLITELKLGDKKREKRLVHHITPKP